LIITVTDLFTYANVMALILIANEALNTIKSLCVIAS
jgi:hypothetical protein